MKLRATQRNDLLRVEYILDVSLFSDHPDLFVFVDEMGSDKRDQKRKHAYSLKGSTPTVNRFLYRGQHVSAIAAMTCNGIVDYSTHVGGVTATFYQLFCYLTYSHLMELIHAALWLWTMPQYTMLQEWCS